MHACKILIAIYLFLLHRIHHAHGPHAGDKLLSPGPTATGRFISIILVHIYHVWHKILSCTIFPRSNAVIIHTIFLPEQGSEERDWSNVYHFVEKTKLTKRLGFASALYISYGTIALMESVKAVSYFREGFRWTQVIARPS